MSNDVQEIDLSPNELLSIRNAFPPTQLPLLYSFRSNIRYEKQSRPNSAVALSPHYIGLFTKDDPASDFFSVSKLVHINEIINVYYSSNPFVVVETKKTKVTITSKKSLHLAHLLYVIIQISYSYYPSKTEFIGDETIFPPINFRSGKQDAFSRFVSFPQQFQFTYAAECSSFGVAYNHDVVRYINSMMLSANSIIDITQLPLDFSQSEKNKNKDTQTEDNKGKNNKKNKDEDNEKDEGKKNKDKKGKKDKKDKKSDKKDKKSNKKKDDKKRKDSKNKNDKSEKSDTNQKSDNDIDNKHDETDDIYENYDFSTVKNTELVPIFKSLRYLEFANGVCCRNFQCPDLLKLLHQLISAGKDIQIIHIENCGVTEGLDYLEHAVKFNGDLEISYWNLSHNQFTNFHPFIMIINYSKGNLLYLNLNDCNISTSDSSELFNAMWRNSMMHNLKYLYISGMNFVNEKNEVQLSSFEKYISRNGNIEILDISQIKSEAASEILSIFTEKPNKIKTLLLKDVDFSTSKITCFEQLLNFLMKTETLENLDLSNTKLNPSQIETVISKIATNINLRKANQNDPEIGFKLSLGNLNLNGKNILILYRAFLETDMSIWNSLSFDENQMNVNDLKNLVPLLTRMKKLNSLSISGNFDFKMNEIEFALPLILKIPDLKALYLCGNNEHKLKNKISILLDNIYKLDKLNILDVRNNSSYEALPCFVHILHSCLKMKQFFFDGNDFCSLEQFENLTGAIHDNKTVISAPFPIEDAQNFIKRCTTKQIKDEDEDEKQETEAKDEDDDKKNKDKKKKKKDEKKKKKKEKENKKKKGKNDDKEMEEDVKNSNTELDEQIYVQKNTFNDHTINDMIKTLSELQVTAVTAVNANRINLKMPNDLPFPTTDEIQNLIQTISSKTRMNIKKKNLNNYSCISEILHLSLPFQNAGDAVRNGGEIHTINIGNLKQYNIKSMEDVIQNKKPIEKMSTMVLPNTITLYLNTLLPTNKTGQDDDNSSDESSDSSDEDNENDSESNEDQKETAKNPKKNRNKNQETDNNDSVSDDEEYDEKIRKKNTKTNDRRGRNDTHNNRKTQNHNRNKDYESSEDDSYDRYTRNTTRNVPRTRNNRHRNSSTESDTDQESDESSSSERRRQRPRNRRRRTQNRYKDDSSDYDSDEDEYDYAVRRRRNQRTNQRQPRNEKSRPRGRKRNYSDSDDETDSESDEIVKPWKNGLKLKTMNGNDNRFDGLVDATYVDEYPKKKGNGRGGYAAGQFDEETLDSVDVSRNARGNRNNRNPQNKKTERKVTFNIS